MKVSLGVLITAASMAFFLPENAQAGSGEAAVRDGQPEAAPTIVDPRNYDPPPLPKPRRVEDRINPDIDGDGDPDIVPEPGPEGE